MTTVDLVSSNSQQEVEHGQESKQFSLFLSLSLSLSLSFLFLLYVQKTSMVRWVYRCPKPVFSSPALLPNGSVIVGCVDGKVYLIRRDGEMVGKYSCTWTAESYWT